MMEDVRDPNPPFNAEAGPSRLPAPSTSTPPTTPSKIKRRSWFSFASPSISLASPVSSPKALGRRGSKGSASIHGAGGEEVLEMTEAISGSLRRFSAESMSRKSGKEAEDSGIEVLTIDGETEETAKRKKKGKRRSMKAQDEGEAVMMDDLSGRASTDAAVRKSHDPGGHSAEGLSQPFSLRTFGRTASDRDSFDSPLDATRRSSDTQPSKSPVGVQDLETSQPQSRDSTSLIPSDRPLPRLPYDTKALPSVPRGIVVTPSSPRKLSKRSPHAAVPSTLGKTDKRRQSTSRSRSRDSSSSRRLRHVKSFNLGLGLPISNEGNSDDAPSVHNKAQTVSSPLPSRGPSPTPRIVFAQPEILPKEEKDTQTAEKVPDKKGRAKRARSLSGLLNRPPLVEAKPNSRPVTPEPEKEQEEEEEVTTVKASGVLGWFGVKKTVKRRTSESKLRSLATAGLLPPSRAPSPGNASIGSRNHSRESLRSHDSSDDARRPTLGAASSSITIVPDNKNRRSMFRIRSSSRGPETSPPIDAWPIPITTDNSRRTSAAESSRSSLRRPSMDATSPGLLQGPNWATSPGEEEETLFSPEGSANWGPGVRPWMDGTEPRRSNTSSVSSALVALPEQANIDSAEQSSLLPAPITVQHGRVRSWSDAPLPQGPSSTRQINGSETHLPSADAHLSTSLHAPPFLTARPKLPGRSNSGNSVIMSRMKTVFSKSTSRGRSQTLLRQPSSDIDEFGFMRPGGDGPVRGSMRPSSVASSHATSIRGVNAASSAQAALLGLTDSDRQALFSETPERSPRTSIAAPSISSVGTGSTRTSAPLEPPANRRGRARASTMFSGPSSYVAPQPPAHSFPVAATPPRRRPSVIQRLSSGVLRSGPSSPRNPLFPLPPRSSGSVSSSFNTPLGGEDTASSMTSPRPSAGSVTAAMGTTSLKAIATREDEEVPEKWLDRVSSKIGRDEIANVLAESGDEFHTTALKIYMARFDFTHNALDVALRRLLMHMSLPRETQQIDRIIEAFAVRYEDCEPGLFTHKDNTYILAFSMMMLHTDAFNKHNKNKMTKPDYVRNTRIDGVPPLVLEAFFDNITFTPFVFIEDDSDLQRFTEPLSASTFTTATSSQFTTTPKNGKIDVYHMIVKDLLGSLRVDMESDIPPESPYSCIGTLPSVNTEASHQAFVMARNLIVVPPKRKNSGAGLLGTTPSKSSTKPEQEMLIKVTKVGLLSRRDESMEGSKKSRKWKSWSVILTGSQLLFFKDPAWALTLLEQMKSPLVDRQSGQPLLPRMTNFKPDEVFPIKDCIAAYDTTYSEYPHTFRFIMPSHRQYSLQASDEAEMNEWINFVNYASVFRSAGLRIKGMSMGKDRAVLAGAAAAASHKRDLQAVPKSDDATWTPRKPIFGADVASKIPQPNQISTTGGGRTSEEDGVAGRKGVLAVDAGNDICNEGEQLEEVFDVVKAELAAGRGGAMRRITNMGGAEEMGRTSSDQHASRADHLQLQIRAYETKAHMEQTTLSALLGTSRKLAILTPFQKATRDRVAAAVPGLAANIRRTRLNLAKFNFYVEVLRRDLIHDQREMARLRHVALQAAAKSLRDPLGVKSVVQDVNAGDETEVPVLSLPIPIANEDHDGDRGGHVRNGDSHSLGTSPGELPVIFRRSSDEPVGKGTRRPGFPRQTSAASYRSSTSETGLRRSSSDLLSSRDAFTRPETPREENGTGISTPLFALSDVEDEGTVQGHENGSGLTIKGTDEDMGIQMNAGERNARAGLGIKRASTKTGKDEADLAKEQAEDWMKTRAARRVSLANIPDLHRLHTLGPEGKGDGVGEDTVRPR